MCELISYCRISFRRFARETGTYVQVCTPYLANEVANEMKGPFIPAICSLLITLNPKAHVVIYTPGERFATFEFFKRQQR